MVEIITENHPFAIQKVKDFIKNGKIVSFPTDTVYALACDVYNQAAISNIYSIKKRASNKPLAILTQDINMVEKICEISAIEREVIKYFCPGALTIILKLKKNDLFPGNINDNSEYIGVRIPDHKFCLDLLKELNSPIVATSANISGNEDSTNPKMIYEYFGGDLEIVVDGGETKIGKPSTVISLQNNCLQIIRPGALDHNLIESFYKKSCK